MATDAVDLGYVGVSLIGFVRMVFWVMMIVWVFGLAGDVLGLLLTMDICWLVLIVAVGCGGVVGCLICNDV